MIRAAGRVGLAALRRRRGRDTGAAGAAAGGMVAGATIPPPPGADWAWRPAPWSAALPVQEFTDCQSPTALSDDVTVFHDSRLPGIAIRQVAVGAAVPDLQIDVHRFDGTFLSLVVEFPDKARAALRRNHILRLSAALELERTVDVYARLNVTQAPNTEQIVRKLAQEDGVQAAEFDLSNSGVSSRPVDRIWVDLIFETPGRNSAVLRDVTLSRRPRAEM
ncbi:hypothetical protein SAMN04488047_105103 [Tranquillimonas alkanivorans]|uniref:Uncharacterized protein n=2 Tax=Tranquillimonas alkanivorans TaxID=441119 RepID=A0A1I5PGV8_9RHOB|nr:hypothetical protein SAMN04488047_105103 [Tranquillimonas alkanivorans]